MRCLALAQEVQARAGTVVLAGELAVPWVAQAYAEAGITVVAPPTTPPELVTVAALVDADAVLLDGYDIAGEYGAALQSARYRVGAMVDDSFGAHQVADLYIDQNPGSRPRLVKGNARALAGADYTLFRNDVLAARRFRSASDRTQRSRPARVLAVFGGTDPLGAAPIMTPLILESAARTSTPVVLDVVTQDNNLQAALAEVTPPGSSVTVFSAVTDLAARAADADLVVTASGSTVWELLCIGVPTAVVCVVDNQSPGYDFATAGDYVAGLGHLASLRTDPKARSVAVAALDEALSDDAARNRRAQRGLVLMDGRGRARVANALLPLT